MPWRCSTRAWGDGIDVGNARNAGPSTLVLGAGQTSAETEQSDDGQGQVLRQALADPSGYGLLDQEAAALLQRAQPLPAPPDGRPRTFRIPIVFMIR